VADDPSGVDDVKSAKSLLDEFNNEIAGGFRPVKARLARGLDGLTQLNRSCCFPAALEKSCSIKPACHAREVGLRFVYSQVETRRGGDQ